MQAHFLLGLEHCNNQHEATERQRGGLAATYTKMRQALVLGLLVGLACKLTSAQATANSSRTFTIAKDRFSKDGQPFQIISGRFDPISSGLRYMLALLQLKFILW